MNFIQATSYQLRYTNNMSILESIVYGLIQGLTEFIPVSSSGHLQLLSEVFGFDSSFETDVLINIGTLIATFIYFRIRIFTIIQDALKDQDYKMIRNLVVSTLPAALIGFFFIDFFGADGTRTLPIVIFMLASVGLIMIFLDRIVKKSQSAEVQVSDAVAIGLAQVLAFIPGTSRSGSTILAARARNLSYETAIEYSFILGIPVIAGAILRVLITDEGINFIKDNPESFIVGNLVAFLSGMIAIHAMVKLTQRIGLKWFGYYRVLLALVLLIFVL